MKSNPNEEEGEMEGGPTPRWRGLIGVLVCPSSKWKRA